MPRAAVVDRPDLEADVATHNRQPGQFARHPKTGAPWVAHPTETSKSWGLDRAQLIALCVERGISLDSEVRYTKAMFEALLGPKPKKVQYGRPSGLGKQIENTTNLQKWAERAVALGLFLDPSSFAEIEALDDEHHNLDDAETRELLDTIVVQAKNRAQAGIAAERGTHAHELTEDYDTETDIVARITRGEQLGLPSDVQHALVAAWEKALQHFGFEILAVEALCVDDLWRQAGTLDRIVRLTQALRFVVPTGEIVELPAGWVGILDIKTGRLRLDDHGFVSYWLAYAVQCASYAQSVPYDPDTDTRGEWPFEIDQRWAIIAHLDMLAALDGEAVCRLVLVDLEAGRHAGALCVAGREWEKRTDVFSIVTDDNAVRIAVTPSAGEVVDLSPAEPIAAPSVPPDVEQPAGGSPPELPAEIAPEESSKNGRRAGVTVTPPQRDRPAEAPPASPVQSSAPGDGAAARRRAQNNQIATAGREGAAADDRAVAMLQERFAKLPADAKAWVGSLVTEGKEAGAPWNPGGLHSTRRLSLGRAVLRLADCRLGNAQAALDDIVRGLLGAVTGREEVEQDSLPLGAAIGSLDAGEATRLVVAVDKYVGDLVAT